RSVRDGSAGDVDIFLESLKTREQLRESQAKLQAHEKGTRAREFEVADLKRRIEEAQQTARDKIQKLQQKIRTLVDENGELKEGNEMKSLTIESLRRGQKELQERATSLEKHRERLREVVDHLAGQLATKDASLR
ncbi:hypothetical protein FOZ62_009630, partial [Perkinsus olseni]